MAVPLYHQAVDVIATNYKKQYKMHEKDIDAIAEKLRDEWKTLSAKVKKVAKKSINKKVK